MSGDTNNASIWTDADVYIDFTGTATDPADSWSAFGSEWDLVGLLDGGEGMEEERDEDTSEHYAWGGVVVRKTRSNHKRTVKFVAMEDNDTTFRIVNPGSTRGTPNGDGVTISKIKVPRYENFRIAFETRDGDKVKRKIADATIEEIGSVKASEEEPEVFEITVLILPEGDGTLFTEVSGPSADPSA